MAIKIKVQKDYLLTEASVELPANPADVDYLLKSTKSTGKMVVLYNNGHIQGINVEQRSKLSYNKSSEIRATLAIEDVTL